MLRVTLRDLQWRRRRFVIAIIGTSLVFAMTLVLTGLSNGFRVESEVAAAARIPGVDAAVPLVYAATTVPDGDSTRNVNVFGAPAQGPGMPAITAGRAPASVDEAAVSSVLGSDVGEPLEIGSRSMRIVGILDDSTALAAQPNVFVTVAGAQQMGYSDQPIVSSIGIRGTPARIPDGYRAIDRAGAVVVGYTGQAFRERLGPAGVRDLIEHRELAID